MQYETCGMRQQEKATNGERGTSGHSPVGKDDEVGVGGKRLARTALSEAVAVFLLSRAFPISLYLYPGEIYGVRRTLPRIRC